MDVAIKNIREEDWKLIKTEAIKNNLNIGDFLNKMIVEYKKSENKIGNWAEIVYGKKTLKEKDIGKIKEVMKDFRKEIEFR